MTRKRVVRLPKNELGNDPHDFRHYPEFVRDAPVESLLDGMSAWILTEEEEMRAKEGYWLYENVIWHNHACVLAGEANSGKTRIAMHMCCAIAQQGVDVRYINMDVNPADAVALGRTAREAGVKLMCPDLKGITSSEVLENLRDLARSSEDMSDLLIVIDNLKQIVDVINKKQLKEVMQLLCRTLTRNGATVLLLTHTNKYKDKDGNPIFEGTNDLRDLTTELFYLIVDKREDYQTVQLICNKDRIPGKVEPVSFEIDHQGNISKSETAIDVRESIKQRKQKAKDQEGIFHAIDRLKTEPLTETELAKHVAECAAMGINASRKLLKRYSGQPNYWRCERGSNNSWIYRDWSAPADKP